jgi:hypothetical protein
VFFDFATFRMSFAASTSARNKSAEKKSCSASRMALSSESEGTSIAQMVKEGEYAGKAKISQDSEAKVASPLFVSLKEQWANSVSSEIQEVINELRNKASLAEKRAGETYCRALDATFLTRNALWQETEQKAGQVEEAWKAVVAKCESYRERAVPDLQQCWTKIIKDARRIEAAWEEAKRMTEAKNSAKDSFLAKHFFSFSKEERNDLKRFPFATLIHNREEVDSKTRTKEKIQILKTMLPYPYIRICQKRSSAGNLIDHKEMAAGQLLVTLQETADPNLFLQKIRDETKRQDIKIQAYSKEYRSSYCLNFPPELDLLPAVSEAAESFGALDCKPNFFIVLQQKGVQQAKTSSKGAIGEEANVRKVDSETSSKVIDDGAGLLDLVDVDVENIWAVISEQFLFSERFDYFVLVFLFFLFFPFFFFFFLSC